MARTAIKTTKEEIAKYWFSRVDESGLSVDAAEALERCWRCGCEHDLERCHIVPDSRGGEDKPANLVLLCKRCHADGPDVTDPEMAFWAALSEHGDCRGHLSDGAEASCEAARKRISCQTAVKGYRYLA